MRFTDEPRDKERMMKTLLGILSAAVLAFPLVASAGTIPAGTKSGGKATVSGSTSAGGGAVNTTVTTTGGTTTVTKSAGSKATVTR
jgi:hypothetical protein